MLSNYGDYKGLSRRLLTFLTHTLATKCRLTNWLTMWLTLDDITHNRNHQTLTRLEHSVLLMWLYYAMLWVFGFWFSVFCLGFRRVQPAFLSHHLKLFVSGTWPNTCQSAKLGRQSVSPSVVQLKSLCHTLTVLTLSATESGVCIFGSEWHSS